MLYFIGLCLKKESEVTVHAEEVNQEENLNRIITVPNLLSFFGFV